MRVETLAAITMMPTMNPFMAMNLTAVVQNEIKVGDEEFSYLFLV